MPVSKKKKVVHIAVPLEVLDSMNKVVSAFRRKGMKINKSILLTQIYLEWLVYQNEEIEQALKEEKENA